MNENESESTRKHFDLGPKVQNAERSIYIGEACGIFATQNASDGSNSCTCLRPLGSRTQYKCFRSCQGAKAGAVPVAVSCVFVPIKRQCKCNLSLPFFGSVQNPKRYMLVLNLLPKPIEKFRWGHFLSPGASGGIRTRDRRIRIGVCYRCAI